MGLFWKIFVSLTIAILASLIGTIYVSVRLTDFAFEQVEFEGRDQIVAQMQAALSTGGRLGLVTWLQQNPRPAPNTIVLVWDTEWWRLPGGRQRGPQDLLNRAMPSQLERYLDASARPDRQLNRPVPGGSRAVAWPLM